MCLSRRFVRWRPAAPISPLNGRPRSTELRSWIESISAGAKTIADGDRIGRVGGGGPRALGIKKETVTTYLKQIRRDYATAGRPVGNTQGAYYLAVKHGLVPGPTHDNEGDDIIDT
jgi:hypothetical protein